MLTHTVSGQTHLTGAHKKEHSFALDSVDDDNDDVQRVLHVMDQAKEWVAGKPEYFKGMTKFMRDCSIYFFSNFFSFFLSFFFLFSSRFFLLISSLTFFFSSFLINEYSTHKSTSIESSDPGGCEFYA
jgi:hypothetical protein